MFEKIVYMSNSECYIQFNSHGKVVTDLINIHVVFEDPDRSILGEIYDFDGEIVRVRFLGEFYGNQFTSGTTRKPSLSAKIRFIEAHEIPLVFGDEEDGYIKFGTSPLYNRFPVYLSVNPFFSNHFAIFGNTGSGKSCGVTRIFENLFQDFKLAPVNSNFFLFDSTGEYKEAFEKLCMTLPRYHYRFISTRPIDPEGEILRVPIYLLDRDDLALLLQCTSHTQLPIIERMLKLAKIFSQDENIAHDYKNYLIAKAIMTILYTNENAANKRNEIFSLLDTCGTNEFYLEAPIQGIGYVRRFRECFLIDNTGNFTESVLLTQYLSSFIKEEFDYYEPENKPVYYSLDTLEKALNFALISEGWLRNEQTYGDAITVKVRLHSLIVSENAKYFDIPKYISLEQYIHSFSDDGNMNYQIVNINFSDVDDEFAKTLTKILSKFIYSYARDLEDRASIPIHIILEEAHRYIQEDTDRFLFGYNIFERIAKEGRKYGVVLGLISQRPGEISDTVISQCSNFLIFKLNHPTDLKYLREMVPFITDDIIEKQKTLQAGNCLGFGSAFKIPLVVKLDMPDPAPSSANCDVLGCWNGTRQKTTANNPIENPNAKRDDTFETRTVRANDAGTINASKITSNKPSQGIVPYSNTTTNSDPVIIKQRETFELTPNANRQREASSSSSHRSSATDRLLGDSFGTSPSISKLMKF